MSETDTNSETDSEQSVCGSTDTADGEPCQRLVSDGHCFLHSDGGPPDDHGAPPGNANAVTHGLFTDDIEKVVESLGPANEVVAYGLFESLLGESRFDFDVEYRQQTTDFSDTDVDLDGCDGLETDSHERLHYRVPVPQKRLTQASALWTASIMELQRMELLATLKAEQLHSTTTKHAQLDGNDEWVTIEEPVEHYLCLPLSRLCRDMKRLLEQGGVPVDGSDGDDVDSDLLADLPFGD